MEKNAIHENLNTSFVDLRALVRHLCGLQFVGKVRVELCSYEADIVFTESSRLVAREFDHLTGNFNNGEQAFRNILRRSREPNGRIHVLRDAVTDIGYPVLGTFVDRRISNAAQMSASAATDSPASHLLRYVSIKPISPAEVDAAVADLIEVVSGLLATVDESLAKGNLDFESAFRAACRKNAERFPRFDPERCDIEFRKGKLEIAGPITASELVEGVVAAISGVLGRMAEKPAFKKVHAFARHRILSYAHAERDRIGRFLPGDMIDDLIR
jgi:hypothetical protein